MKGPSRRGEKGEGSVAGRRDGVRLIAPGAVAVLGASCAVAVPAVAWAQEFVKVEDGAREQLPATPFVGVAYGFIWVALLVYLLSVARGLGRVQKELSALRRRLDRSEDTHAAKRG